MGETATFKEKVDVSSVNKAAKTTCHTNVTLGPVTASGMLTRDGDNSTATTMLSGHGAAPCPGTQGVEGQNSTVAVGPTPNTRQSQT